MIIIDNIIKNEQLIKEIKNDADFFPSYMGDVLNFGHQNNYFHDGSSDCYAPFMFWDGWWSSPANTPRKRVIETIFKDTNILTLPLSEIIGFEYFCRTYKSGQYIKPHVDQDTFSYADGKKFNAPAYGAIWYGFSECLGGGYLEIHKSRINGYPENALDKKNFTKLESPAEDLERIAYRPNRLICFDAGRVPHNTTPVVDGTRQAMVISVWHKDFPPLALAMGKFFYE